MATRLKIKTSEGDIIIRLYDETPQHRDNFLKLAKEKYLDGTIFHRVIKDFMIQGGDPESKNAPKGKMLGTGGPDYTIPAEFVYPQYFHKRGALSAARTGDEVNPNRESSGSQFYIVWGIRFTDKQLDWAQERLDAHTGGIVKMSPAVRQLYKTEGGSPHLDGQYTVFGQVVDGLDVVDRIQRQPVDDNDRPTTDLRIRKAIVLK